MHVGATTGVCVCAPPGRIPCAGAVASPADVALARRWVATVAVVSAGSVVTLTADIFTTAAGARRADRKLPATLAVCRAADEVRLTADCRRGTGAEHRQTCSVFGLFLFLSLCLTLVLCLCVWWCVGLAAASPRPAVARDAMN